MELISVIMPTYNAAKWVTCTIDNLAAQTYPHFELIVTDDGSQDDTVSVVRNRLAKSFKNPWQIIELGKNRGPSAARNLALRAARGTWVQYLDSDDFIAPSKFEIQAARCARVSAQVSAVYSPWRQCHIDDGRVTLLGEMVQPDMEGRAPIMCLAGHERVLLGAGLTRRSAIGARAVEKIKTSEGEAEEKTTYLEIATSDQKPTSRAISMENSTPPSHAICPRRNFRERPWRLTRPR